MNEAKQFEQIYEHLSVNSYDYELFCFQRWYIILNFIQKHKLNHFLCLDSDVILYSNVNEVFGGFLDYDFTICKEMIPCFTLFNAESLNKFCNYMTSLYSTDNIYRLKDFFKTLEFGGICDMTVFTWYQKEISDNILDLVFPINNFCFDGNISDSMGFEMNGRHKKIYWIDNLPYGKWLGTTSYVRFGGLHLQGGAKHKMHHYFLDNEKCKDDSWIMKSQWLLSRKRLKNRIKEMKKILSSKELFYSTVKKLF